MREAPSRLCWPPPIRFDIAFTNFVSEDYVSNLNSMPPSAARLEGTKMTNIQTLQYLHTKSRQLVTFSSLFILEGAAAVELQSTRI